MTLPLIGVHQANEPFWASPPRVHSGALVHWRHLDGELRPLTGQAVTRTPPSSGATLLTAVSGVTRVQPRGHVGWETRPWDDSAGGLQDELLARLAPTEVWRIGGEAPLRLTVDAMTVWHEWIESDAWSAGTLLWSLANALTLGAADGGYLAAERASTTSITVRFHNGVSQVTSVVTGVELGDRCQLRATLTANGSGGLALRAHLARNGGPETNGAASSALTAPAVWGTADDAHLYVFGRQALRTLHLREGVCSRALLTSTL